MSEIIVLLFFVAGGWFWADTMRARERARTLGKQACERESVQFLDDTVALAKLRLRRDHYGHVRFWRTYRFEFSDTGNNRRDGSVVLLGQKVEAVEMEPHRVAPEVAQSVVVPFPTVRCGGGCGCGDEPAPRPDGGKCGDRC